MKKYGIISLVCLLSLFLVACGSRSSKPSSQKDSKAKTIQTTTTQKKKTSMTSSKETTQAESSSDMRQEKSGSESTEISENKGSTSGNNQTPASHNGTYFSVTGKYGDEIIIVNKKHPLPASYAPGENPTALAAFQRLIADMQGLGYAVSNSYSGFRSYENQAQIYQNYVNRDGQSAADRYSARPGHSEHQSGLAFDLIDTSGNLLEEPQASAWLKDHAHDYGFVVRYLPGKEAITGYMPESWHVRYIGTEAADIVKSGLTLEEYYGVDGGDYVE